ncbi:MAG: SpoIIE family protein phosphatase, partial [bacterium]|nr:SpoIIE family protein phosphatase [bacterium]
MNALAANFNACDLVDRVLQTTTEAINAQRGAVVFAGENGKLRPCDVCGRVHTIREGKPQPADVEDIQISETVAQRVLKDGENVLYQGGMTDTPWDTSKSIQALKLSSILCVPIRTQNAILGILYVDTDMADHSYTQDDMLLAAAAGNSAGLALENARNHRDLMDKQRTDQEIAAAGTIQEGFLIKDWPEDDPRFEVYGETRPARIVGGDFYDFVRLDPDRVGIFIGDVSGKGVPAALTMALLLAEFRANAVRASSPAQLLAQLNQGFVDRSRRGTFCTICYVTINLVTGEMVAANAGHHPLLLASGDEVSTMFDASGPPVGVVQGELWEDAKAFAESGDSLLLYTDGIVEARAATTQVSSHSRIVEYDMDNLENLVAEHSRSTPAGLIGAILEDVLQYCAPLAPHDDCTMIALRYLGS